MTATFVSIPTSLVPHGFDPKSWTRFGVVKIDDTGILVDREKGDSDSCAVRRLISFGWQEFHNRVRVACTACIKSMSAPSADDETYRREHLEWRSKLVTELGLRNLVGGNIGETGCVRPDNIDAELVRIANSGLGRYSPEDDDCPTLFLDMK